MHDFSYIGTLVEFERSKIDEFELRGIVLDISEEFTLLNVLTDDFRLNGFAVIRNEYVTRYRVYDSDDYFLNRALRLKGIKPGRRPKVDLQNLAAALVSAQRLFPLITLHPEQKRRDVCYIGRIVGITEKTITLHEIEPGAEWGRPRRHRLCDITKIDFGGGYEDALWRVAVEDGHVPPIGV
jgi:hypothetical protein